jgi:glycogen debranching enzyme
LGQFEKALELRRQAARLRERFEKTFWCEDLSTYAIALDGKKSPCRVRTSNAGHCLYTGIASEEHAQGVAGVMFDSGGYSGWGIRTVAGSQARYNPMSYHNGSVWPHDNALVAMGLARYGRKDLAARVLTGMFDLSLFVNLHRIPELFCGFQRRPGKGPTQYPVACAPQSWAAAAVFLLLQACLGLSVRARRNQISFDHPLLPESLERVDIYSLRCKDSVVDLKLERYGDIVGIDVKRREGDVEIVSVV